MFESGFQNQVPGRYAAELVSGEMRQKGHHHERERRLGHRRLPGHYTGEVAGG